MAWSSLEMMMIRSRSPTSGTIVEKSESTILPCQIQHIHISLPYALIRMLCLSYHQMLRENRVWIDQNMIFLILTSFEFQHYLLRRTIVPAEETFSIGNILLVKLRC